jgi:nucleoside-diphosphate-sugar epimerase
VEEKPADMMEYAMAKAAGEMLCSYASHFVPGLRTVVRRLPRLATDQTASVIPVNTTSALAVLLPIVREVEERK